MLSFALKPSWGINHLLHKKFELSQLKDHIAEGTSVAVSVGEYFTKMCDQSLNWKTAEEINKYRGKDFALKGIMSVEDA